MSAYSMLSAQTNLSEAAYINAAEGSEILVYAASWTNLFEKKRSQQHIICKKNAREMAA